MKNWITFNNMKNEEHKIDINWSISDLEHFNALHANKEIHDVDLEYLIHNIFHDLMITHYNKELLDSVDLLLKTSWKKNNRFDEVDMNQIINDIIDISKHTKEPF